MAKIDNGCGGMMRLCNWIPTAKELERQAGIDKRADLKEESRTL